MAGYPRLFGNSIDQVVLSLLQFFSGLTGGKWDMWLDTLKTSTGVVTDTISERTATSGVTIDSCLIKDGKAADSDKLDGQEGSFYQTATAILSALSGLTWSSGSPLVKMTGTATFGLDATAYITLLAISSTATGLTYTNTTGVFSLTTGYVIPTTTQETNWGTAYTHSQIAGGNSVHVSVTENTNWDAAYTHVSNNGSDHSYIDQSVKQADGPTFDHVHLGTTKTLYFT